MLPVNLCRSILSMLECAPTFAYTTRTAQDSRYSQLAFMLAEKKIDATHYASELIRALKYKDDGWMLKSLYDRGMEMNPKNIPAMLTCIKAESAEKPCSVCG